MNIKLVAPLATAAVILAACAQDGNQKQTAGTIVGGIGGAVLGSQVGGGSGRIVATAVGTLAGALIGSEVGKSLDKADRAEMRQAEQQAHSAPVGETIEWNNPDTGNYGSVTPVRDGRSTQTGAYCREYQTSVNVGGRQEEAYGTACQQPDGSWEIVS